MSKEIPFFCPRCGKTTVDEIMIDIVVCSRVNLITEHEDGVELDYGQQTNSDGYVNAYLCGNCGLSIVDDTSPHADDGLDEYALVKAIKAMNVGREAEIQAVLDAREPETLEKGDQVSFCEIIDRITEANESLTGQELADAFNRVSPDQVVYEGDSIFWVKT